MEKKEKINIRRAAVAGAFYTASAKKLQEEVLEYLSQPEIPILKEEIIALVAPHAGYMYSGAVAGYAYKQIEGKNIQTVILLGPSHHYPLDKEISVYCQGAFETPLGLVEIDEELAKKIINTNIKFIPEAHRHEHSLEVQLPFLQSALKTFKIVPILTNDSSPEGCKRLATKIVNAIKECNKKENIIVASSDLSHLSYPEIETAKKIDLMAIDSILKLDPFNLQDIPCGEAGIATAILVAKELGAKSATLLKYTNSYEITGDRSWVVGYAAIAITK